MACLTSCRLCGAGLIDCYLCNECNAEIARRAKEGLPYDEEEVARVVKQKRYERIQRENQERLEEMIESSCRDNWKEYRNRADALQDKINEAIKVAKEHTGIYEVDKIRRILEAK